MQGHPWILRLVFPALLAACESEAPSAPLFSGTSVEIVGAPSDSVLLVDAEIQLTARVRSADGNEVTNIQPRWTSSDPSRATIAADGRVMGRRPGELHVRVNAAGATDERAISVRTGVPLPSSGDSPLTTTLLDGAVQVTVTAGAVPDGAVLHVRTLDDPVPHARLIGGTAVEIGPAGVSFGSAITLGLRYPASVSLAERPFIRLHRLVDAAWSPVSSGSVDLDAGRALGAITRTGTYALLRPASVATLSIDAGDRQQALAGSYVAIAPRVVVRDAEERPVQGAVIRFFVSAGGGAIVGDATAVSDADGRATLPGRWLLGPTATSNALTAEVVGSDVAPVRFSATAETVTLVITRELGGAISGRRASTQPRLEFRTGSGDVLPVSDGVTAELISGNGTLVGTLRVDASNGVVVFTDLRIDGSGVHRLRFTSGGHQLNGSEFTVTQELATLRIVVQPAGAVEDRAFSVQPVIQLLDDAGLPYLPETAVSASIASGPGDLRGERTIVSSGGRVNFTNLRINDHGVHRLRFATTSPSRSVTSDSFTVIED